MRGGGEGEEGRRRWEGRRGGEGEEGEEEGRIRSVSNKIRNEEGVQRREPIRHHLTDLRTHGIRRWTQDFADAQVKRENDGGGRFLEFDVIRGGDEKVHLLLRGPEEGVVEAFLCCWPGLHVRGETRREREEGREEGREGKEERRTWKEERRKCYLSSGLLLIIDLIKWCASGHPSTSRKSLLPVSILASLSYLVYIKLELRGRVGEGEGEEIPIAKGMRFS